MVFAFAEGGVRGVGKPLDGSVLLMVLDVAGGREGGVGNLWG
jgi:hypothetical protein